MFDDEDYDPEAERKRIESLPVYIKAREILDLVNRMLEGLTSDDLKDSEFEDEKDFKEIMFKQNSEYLLSNAMTIPVKIAGAEGAGLYDLRMENAAIIRKAARELITDARGLQMNGFADVEYLDLLRTEVENLRVLFAEWIKTFDKEDYIIDRWNVFNPPGVNYDDHDPDDDIPFDPSDHFPEDL
ncbi:MAG: hypothetical protein WBG46_14975 [Nonlabens sp.]